MSTSNYTNPYEHLSLDQTTRFSINLSNEDAEFFRRIRPGTGLVQTTLALLVKKLKQALEQKGIIQYDPERYEQFVAECCVAVIDAADTDAGISRSPVVDGDRPADSLPPGRDTNLQAVDRNDGRGTPSLPCTASDAPSIVPDLGKSPKGKSKADRIRKGKANKTSA